MSEDLEDFISKIVMCCDNGKVCSEKGKRFEIKSNEVFTRMRIDPCVIPDKTKIKCDFGFIRHSNEHFIFVELKGGGISHGIDQLISTINHFNQHFVKISKNKISCYIVSSKFPKGQDEQKKLQRFAKEFGSGCLKIKNNQNIINI